MLAIQIILGALIFYFVIIFVLPRIFIPFMGFGQYKPPKNLPEDVKRKITELENSSENSLQYLKNAYDFVLSRWRAERAKTITHLHLAFRTDLEKLWQTPGYTHCHTMNFILYTLMANSKFFKDEDVKIKHIFFNGVPHQHMEVKVGEEWMHIDPALNYVRGIAFGKRFNKWFG